MKIKKIISLGLVIMPIAFLATSCEKTNPQSDKDLQELQTLAQEVEKVSVDNEKLNQYLDQHSTDGNDVEIPFDEFAKICGMDPKHIGRHQGIRARVMRDDNNQIKIQLMGRRDQSVSCRWRGKGPGHSPGSY